MIQSIMFIDPTKINGRTIYQMFADKADPENNLSYTALGIANTWDDWKILPVERPVFSPPQQKTTYIDVPGGNGALDLSESLTGFPVYSNRSGSFKFRVMNDYGNWSDRYSEMMTYLHGRTLYAILEDDSMWFYKGRFSVDSWDSGDTWSQITIGYNVEPYKWSVDSSIDPWRWDPFNFNTDAMLSDTFHNIQISTNKSNSNEWKTLEFDGGLFGTVPISPTFKITNKEANRSITLSYKDEYFGNDSVDLLLREGDNYIPEIVFYGQQKYTLKFQGYFDLSIEFRMGRL